MKNKKIGILTMYYKSQNYGGVLQAYALTKYLNRLGFDAEQICYDRFNEKTIKGRIKDILLFLIHNICSIIKTKKTNTTRKVVSSWAMNNIPHSKRIYNKNNIKNTINDYDIFISGSDQIWTNAFSETYLLGFVPNSKLKISYAASMGNLNFDETTIHKFNKYLASYDAISLRETEAVSVIKKHIDLDAEWCVDPTLLLDANEWNELCTENLINERYIFCYFLGSSSKTRKLAEQYGKKNNLKVVSFPHLHGKVEKVDLNFGDVQLYDSDPSQFITLIRHSEIVFTDSFHACVFSIIFDRPFCVFRRSNSDKMVSRLYSLMELTDCASCFCDSDEKEASEYIERVSKTQSINLKKLLDLKKKSEKFLVDNLSCSKDNHLLNYK